MFPPHGFDLIDPRKCRRFRECNVIREKWVASASSVALFAASLAVPGLSYAQSISVSPAKMPRVGSVSDRFQSYNIEMVEVTGGRFWAPYKLGSDAAASQSPAKTSTPPGMDPSLYRYRSPIDLSNPRLRALAAA